MTKFLQDSYNGLYKVLLKPYMPSGKTLALLVVGVLIGLFWAYVLAPAIFYDADPSTLQQSWQDEWVKLIADRNAASNFDVSANLVDLLRRVDDPVGIVDRLSVTEGEEANFERLQAIRPLAEQAAAAGAASAPQPNVLSNILPFIVAPIVIVIIAVIVALLWGLLLKSNVYDPLMKRLRGEKVSAEVQQMRQQISAVRQAEATQRTDFANSTYGAPLMQRMSTFLLGHGQYDDSFSIEDAQERFLGECGASISETIGVGEPLKPTAIEVWLFDKDDISRTMTKVFVSEYANSDGATRAKLQPKGDLVVAQPGAVIVLETANLRLQARIVDLEYGPGPLPEKSYFQKMTIELASWRKEGATATAPVAAPPVPVASPPPVAAPVTAPAPAVAPVAASNTSNSTSIFAPPPRPSAPPATVPVPASPPAPAFRPAAPPAARPPADDDPFGGTGDFTPIT